jgi:hypothetical protein
MMTVWTLCFALALVGSQVRAQEPDDVATAPPAGRTAGDELTPEELYVDFVHFVVLGRFDVAEAYGQISFTLSFSGGSTSPRRTGSGCWTIRMPMRTRCLRSPTHDREPRSR